MEPYNDSSAMLPNLHLSFTLHFLDLVGKELPLILAPKNPKDVLKKRRGSPSQALRSPPPPRSLTLVHLLQERHCTEQSE
ncbi:hypothetical protein TNCV_738941 [Trichonephila clavipes]|nr:hypothetical protein TNCV_738941 [Trichonephila clavipes]